MLGNQWEKYINWQGEEGRQVWRNSVSPDPNFYEGYFTLTWKFLSFTGAGKSSPIAGLHFYAGKEDECPFLQSKHQAAVEAASGVQGSHSSHSGAVGTLFPGKHRIGL